MNPALPRRQRWAVSVAVAALVVAATAVARPLPHGAARPDEAPFIADIDAAMDTMMDGMAIQPSGDVDRDFVAMMAAHHQGAIDMAQAELRHGQNEHLRRLAQEIIVTQRQEMATMRLALLSPRPPAHRPTVIARRLNEPRRPDESGARCPDAGHGIIWVGRSGSGCGR